MKTYRINVVQDLYAEIDGTIDIKASSIKSAINKLRKMSNKNMEKEAHWIGCDEARTGVRFDPKSIIKV